jgi:hypothetical protein
MIKFLPILSNVISEQKRYQMNPETRSKLKDLADNLWSMRNKKFSKKTMVDQINFQTADGTDGFVKVFVNPKYPNFGEMDTFPEDSYDPMNFVMQVNPKKFGSKKNVFLTLYHEMMYAIDPNFTTKHNEKFWDTYDSEKDDMYWGHPVEFFAITNEFLEGLVIEFERRSKLVQDPEDKKSLLKSFQNILNYFGKGEKLTNQSKDILRRINDEHVDDNALSKVVSDIESKFPNVSELIDDKKDIPYFLYYIELIKKHNPDIWPRFLTMLFKTKDEIINVIK